MRTRRRFIADVTLHVRLLLSATAARRVTGTELAVRQRGGGVEFTVPKVKIHEVVEIRS